MTTNGKPRNLTPDELKRAIDLQRKCWTHNRIADELGLHRVTVTKALSRYNKRVMARMEKRTTAEKAQQIAQLQWVAEQAAEAFPMEFDAALLNQVRGALADIRKIIGMDAPTKTESEVKQSGGIATVILNQPPGVDGPNDRGGE